MATKQFKFGAFRNPASNLPYLNENQWDNLHTVIPDPKVRSSRLAESIVRAGGSSEPRRLITSQECERKFMDLSGKPIGSFMSDPGQRIVRMKHMDYNFNIGSPLGITSLGHSHNTISDYYQHDNRMKCSGYDRISPYQLWTGEGLTKTEHLAHMTKALSVLWRMKNKNALGPSQYQECARLAGNVYTAAQFKPHIAKAIYDFFGASSVLDFSMGWGDRLAGWFTIQKPGVYIGCDPNQSVFDTYQRQIDGYSNWNGTNGKNVDIICSPAEDVDWADCQKVDLIFTSPPYFDTERYAQGSDCESDQSWSRYNTGDAWLQNFLYPVVENTIGVLKSGGHLALNIIDSDQKGTPRLRICDSLYAFCADLGLEYQGWLGMGMKQRPKNFKNTSAKNQYMSDCFVEPVWIWRKP